MIKKQNPSKPYFRYKGRYADGRKRIVIEYYENGKLQGFAIPKPEKLLEILKEIPGQVITGD